MMSLCGRCHRVHHGTVQGTQYIVHCLPYAYHIKSFILYDCIAVYNFTILSGIRHCITNIHIYIVHTRIVNRRQVKQLRSEYTLYKDT